MLGKSLCRSTGIESLEARRLFAVVTAQSADLAGTSQGLIFTFDSPVSNDAVRDSLTIWHGTGGVAVPRAQMVVTMTGTNQVRVTWPGFTGVVAPGVLRKGNYEAVIEDGLGSPFTSRSVLPFFFMDGDANFDRTVNFPDLVALAQNYGLSGKTFAEGNFDYSGSVAFDADLIIVASNYGYGIPELPAASETLMVASVTSNDVTLNFGPPIDPDTGVASTTFSGFRIYRSADGVNYSRAGNDIQSTVLQTGAASYDWTDPTSPTPSTTYSYLVRPYVGTNEEWRFSNEVTATTSPAKGIIERSTLVPLTGSAIGLRTLNASFQAYWSDYSTHDVRSVVDRSMREEILGRDRVSNRVG